MLSKFDGTCCYCKRPTKAGIDTYEPETKRSFHETCRQAGESESPSAEQFALAERLGYIRPGEPIPANWRVWDLHKTDRGNTARRTPRAPRRQQNANLFGEKA